jgi:primase-polymerase (primpol)-like protein
MDEDGEHTPKPTILRGDFASPPPALAPLRARLQWVIWRLTWRAGRWTKPPFRCDDPLRFASSADPSSWSLYETAVAAAATNGDGISYVLTPDDPFAAVDIDHVRDPVTGTIEPWAQRLLDQASHSYVEISPSGTGLRIWGTATGGELHRKFSFDTAALELFRRTHKVLTVTGLQLGTSQQLGNIDALVDRAVIWAEQHKQKTQRGQAGRQQHRCRNDGAVQHP